MRSREEVEKAAWLSGKPQDQGVVLIELLLDIRDILLEMKAQEKEYWETWKQSKSNELRE